MDEFKPDWSIGLSAEMSDPFYQRPVLWYHHILFWLWDRGERIMDKIRGTS